MCDLCINSVALTKRLHDDSIPSGLMAVVARRYLLSLSCSKVTVNVFADLDRMALACIYNRQNLPAASRVVDGCLLK